MSQTHTHSGARHTHTLARNRCTYSFSYPSVQASTMQARRENIFSLDSAYDSTLQRLVNYKCAEISMEFDSLFSGGARDDPTLWGR
eukprot:3612563-Alexandrium_andersonii.AAC.1